MTLIELLETLDVDVWTLNELPDKDREMLDKEIEVHYQPNYPLKTGIAVVKYDEQNDCISMALNESDSGYGSRDAWEEE